jgi:diguanylate cyclase (GGDEF)-like protein/PAS domain S-box-containing protein
MDRVFSFLTVDHDWRITTLVGVIVILAALAVLNLLRQVRASGACTRHRLDIALNNMHQGLVMFDASNRLVLYNERYLTMYRLSPGSLRPGLTLSDFWRLRKAAGTFPAVLDAACFDSSGNLTGHPDIVAFLNSELERRTMTFDLPDGRTISITTHKMPDGGWISTHTDITELTQAARELHRTKRFLDTVVENVPVALFVKNAHDHRYVIINRAGEELLGLPREKMIGKTAFEVFSEEHAKAITARDNKVLESGQQLLLENNWIRTPDGADRIVNTKRLVLQGDDGQPQYTIGVLEDVTERRLAEQQIEHMARHDALTDLPNRSAFTERLRMVLNRAAKTNDRFAVLSIDLDRFKEVNDVFGHNIGDALLCEASRRLKDVVGDAFLARLGGDEFGVILADDAQPAGAAALADQLLAAVDHDLSVNHQRLRIRLSIGVAIYPSDGGDESTLIANADAALDRAKSQGRGRTCFFEPAMDQRLRERRALQHELVSAIARKQLALHYQPQATIAGEIIGFEALARWQHPSRGMIPPGVFIPVAEESGLILSIGEWILREACREAASWPKSLHIAVNLSPIQFRHGDLPGLVHQILVDTGLSPGRLELEITEGVLIGDFARGLTMLRRLKALGVRIAMDDFGTGYSSLSYLQAFPFDKIKIDRTFISNLDSNAQSAAIVRAVIGLGHGLDLPVIAEGVETAEQLAFLARESCNEVQGYFIGKPLPIDYYDRAIGRPNKAVAHKLRLVG